MKTVVLDIYVVDIAQWRTYAFPMEMNWKGVIWILCQLFNDEYPQLMLAPEKARIVCRKSGIMLDNRERVPNQSVIAGMKLELAK